MPEPEALAQPDTQLDDSSCTREDQVSGSDTILGTHKRRLTGIDDMVISLSASLGLTYGEIAAHLAGVYGAEVSRQTITTTTGRVMEGLAEPTARSRLSDDLHRRH